MPRVYVRKTERPYNTANIEDLEKAYQSGLSLRKAAILFGVPKSTLRDYIKNKIFGKKKNNAQRYLSEEHEKVLASAIATVADWGFPLSYDEVRLMTKKMLDSLFIVSRWKDNYPGKDWIAGFHKRNGISNCLARYVNRKKARTEEERATISNFLEEFETFCKQANYVSPDKLLVLDETDLTNEDNVALQLLKGRQRIRNVIDSISMDIYKNVVLDEADISEYAEYAKDWAHTHGIVMKSARDDCLINFAPFMLFPTPFPEYLFKEAMVVQKDFQTLVHRASLDHEFIQESLQSVVIHDEFTKRQYELYDTVRKEGFKPKFYFNITRSDYMIDQATKGEHVNGYSMLELRPYEIKQIEINMIAASFGGLDTTVCKMHSFMADIMGDKAPYKKDKLPLASTLPNLGEGLAKIWQLYGNENAVIVFVVSEGERNRFDQRLLEYSFYDGVKELGYRKIVPVVFASLLQIHKNGQLGSDRRFILGDKEVALFYFRAGYTPQCYADEKAWSARLLIERSIAAKCPTMAGQLVGTKKVQQIFANPGVVERFIKDPEAVRRIRRTFAGLFSLDPGADGDSAADMALRNPSKFVLKPQREGGGNNMYDEELVAELNRVSKPLERSQYILMERIQPPIVKNYIVHADLEKPTLANTVTELGVFGVFISDSDQVIYNDASGHLLRTKDVEHNDGGVAAGRAVLDTPYLIS